MDAVKTFVWRTLVALPFALVLSMIPTACQPEPATPNITVQAADAADLHEADQAWERVYGGMSDEEKMAGVVLEPAD